MYVNIKNRKIMIDGIGRLFYERGFPISLAIEYCNERGVEVSILHVADECMKNGWSGKTTFAKLKEEMYTVTYDLEKLQKFCCSGYEVQREMLFESLFQCTSVDTINKKIQYPVEFLSQFFETPEIQPVNI